MYGYLFFFKKVTEPIFIGLLTMNWLVYFVHIGREEITISKWTRIIFTPLITICLVWGMIRINKINSENIKKYTDWICYYEDLKTNSSIHVNVNSESSLYYLSIVENTLELPINNFISFSHFNITVYEEKKRQFGLKNVTEDLISRSDIVLTGPKIFSLQSYYRKKYNKDVQLVSDSVHYNCAKVYQVISR